MRDNQLRRIARLEKLAQPYLTRKKQDGREWQRTIMGAAHHAAVLAFLIHYGNPRLDEPLSRACERCAESAAWKDCCHEFKSILLKRLGPDPFKPHRRDAVSLLGAPLRHFIISTFPGADEKHKLDAVFAAAPPWLLWFTFADCTAAFQTSQKSRASCDRRRISIFGGACRLARLNASLGVMAPNMNHLPARI